jgi:hypothetical protein
MKGLLGHVMVMFVFEWHDELGHQWLLELQKFEIKVYAVWL